MTLFDYQTHFGSLSSKKPLQPLQCVITTDPYPDQQGSINLTPELLGYRRIGDLGLDDPPRRLPHSISI